MKKAFIVFCIAIMGLIPVTSWGADLLLSWDAPVAYTDGSLLPIEEIKEFNFFNHSGDTFTFIATVAPDQTSYAMTLPAGRYCFVGNTVTIWDVSSAYTSDACVNMIEPNSYELRISFQ